MSGAVMDCRQDRNIRPQHKETSGRHSPGYRLQNHQSQSRQQNTHLQHSKTMNNKLLSDPYVVDGASGHSHEKNTYRTESRCVSSTKDLCLWDPRSQFNHTRVRKPIELPVPKFEVDANYVGEIHREDKINLVQTSKTLDLDTRIDLLIKTKALAGMHPIFSELNESDESNYDSDEPFTNNLKARNRLTKKHNPSPPRDHVSFVGSFDDPEKPLSRPPSPFLSRATYLFWFNKAIELKQQAKEQEQALLDKATKKLLCENLSPVKTNQTENSNSESKPLLDTLLHEVSKELKEIVKQEFINKVLENTAFNTFENWWDKQRHCELKQKQSDNNIVSNLELTDDIYDNLNTSDKDNVKFLSKKDCPTLHGSTSPKEPFPWNREKINNEEMNYYSKESKTVSIRKNENVLLDEMSKLVHESLLRKEDLLSASSKEENVFNKIHVKDSCDLQMSKGTVFTSKLKGDNLLESDRAIQFPVGENLKANLSNNVYQNASICKDLERLHFIGSTLHNNSNDKSNALLLSSSLNVDAIAQDCNKDICESVKNVLNFLITKVDEDTSQGKSIEPSICEEFSKEQEFSSKLTYDTTSKKTSKIATECELTQQNELPNSDIKSNELDLSFSPTKFDVPAISPECYSIKKLENEKGDSV